MISYEQKYLLNCILEKLHSKKIDFGYMLNDFLVKTPMEKFVSYQKSGTFFHIVLKQNICTFEIAFKELDFIFEVKINKDKNNLFIENLLLKTQQNVLRDLLCFCKASVESLYKNEANFCNSFYLKTVGFELELDCDNKIKDLYSEKVIENSLNVKFDKTIRNKNVFVKTLVGI